MSKKVLPYIQPSYGHRYTQWVASGDAGGIESKKSCVEAVIVVEYIVAHGQVCYEATVLQTL